MHTFCVPQVDPVTITDPTPVNGTVFVTDMLVNSTVVPFNTSFCNFGKSVRLVLELCMSHK